MSRRSDILAVVFDFDGVLVDSNRVKAGAYVDIFADIPGASPIVRSVLDEHVGGDRYSVISAMVERLVAAGLLRADGESAAVAADYAARYTATCERGIVAAPEIPGASECLSALHRRRRLYVNSATPEPALRRIVERRGWLRFFAEVLGRPRTKIENLERILERERVRPEAILFVGDGPDDIRAAQTFGCAFVAVRSNFHTLDYRGVAVIDDLSSVNALVGVEGPHAARS